MNNHRSAGGNMSFDQGTSNRHTEVAPLRPSMLGVAVVTVALWAHSVMGAPFVPQDDAQVLEQLRAPTNTAALELNGLRKALTKNPDNLKIAIQVARQYREIGRAESDPRYYGYAQAALRPWWDQDEPPPDVLLLRGILRQAQHNFDGALIDLHQLLQARPQNAQAWLTQAIIHQVRGNYDWARSSCLPLLRLTNALVSTTCIASATSLSGDAQASYNLLEKALHNNAPSSERVQVWAFTTLAEIANRLGHHVKAEQHFQQALSIGLRDTYVLGAYCDFLLDQNRPAEVRALLQDDNRPDGLLLRLALAEEQLNAPQLKKHLENLRTRFTENRLRGDTRHLRLEARFTLQLLKNPVQALELARENWAVQREPWDARILLEASLRSHNPTAAQSVLDWLNTIGLEDIHLEQLVAQLS